MTVPLTQPLPADKLVIVLQREDYDRLVKLLRRNIDLIREVMPGDPIPEWQRTLDDIMFGETLYQPPLAPDEVLQQVSTDELLAEVARRMQSPRESETEPSPAPAVPPQESTSEPAPPSPEPGWTEPALTAREVTARYRGELAGISDEKGWAELEADVLATKVATLRDLLASGIPEDIPITFTPDVMALYGVEEDEMIGTCRMPTRVEVRPESADKKYAVLAFFRGDMQVIVGFRFPRHPGVMAVYLGSMLEDDTHRVNRSGGGGSKSANNSLPTTPKQLINRLKGSGCTVELDPAHTDGITYRVVFHGEDLGLIKSERQPRTQVTNDYNRFLRKMQAITRREAAAS